MTKTSSAQLNPVEMLLQRAQQTPDAPYLHQPVNDRWTSYSWKQVAEQSLRMARALQDLGLPPGSRIGLTGMNTAHWFMADFACALAGYVGVGLYPKQSDEAVRYIAEHSEMKLAFIGPMPDVDMFLAALPAGIKRVALPYPGVPECPMNWDAMIAASAPLEAPVARKLDDLWTLIYTSGTTGQPKGVIVDARNLIFTAQGMLREMPARADGEFLLSYLPLAHAFERGAVELGSLYLGAQVFFLENIDKLAETLAHVRPTRFYGVPLVWTRFQSAILKKLPQQKLDRLLRIPLLSGYIKRKLKQGMGFDRCWLRISGAAPLPLPVLHWFGKLGLDIYQGYGMTENSIYVSCNLPHANRAGSVGKPYQDSLIRISPEGEIQNKHDGITAGYYKDAEKTAELFTDDGWLKTGDVGRLDDDGFLYITGRVKEIFKTLKGKYVTPAPIEGAFSRNVDVEQSCLVGSGMQQPVLLVCLNADARAKPKNAIEAGLLETMSLVNADLEAHEAIAKVIITRNAWTIDSGLVTPTMKVRRNQVEKQFASLIEQYDKKRDVKVVWE